MICFDCSARSAGEWCLVALRMLSVWMLPRSATLPLSKTLQLPSFSLHLVRGFSPPLRESTGRRMKMLYWMRTDCQSCCSTLKKASVTDMIFSLSLSLSEDTEVHHPPRWKIYLTALSLSGSTIIVGMRLWNRRQSIKWHLKLWAFQMGCKVDKGCVTDFLLSVGHPDIYVFFPTSPEKLQLLTWKKNSTKVAIWNHIYPPSVVI